MFLLFAQYVIGKEGLQEVIKLFPDNLAGLLSGDLYLGKFLILDGPVWFYRIESNQQCFFSVIKIKYAALKLVLDKNILNKLCFLTSRF